MYSKRSSVITSEGYGRSRYALRRRSRYSKPVAQFHQNSVHQGVREGGLDGGIVLVDALHLDIQRRQLPSKFRVGDVAQGKVFRANGLGMS